MEGVFYIYKMIKLEQHICIKELGRLMQFGRFQKADAIPKRLMGEFNELHEMHQNMKICNSKSSAQWLEVTNKVKININPVWFSNRFRYQFPVQLIQWRRSNHRQVPGLFYTTPVISHLKCCIKVGDQIVEICKFYFAVPAKTDWETYRLKYRKMILLCRQLDEYNEMITGK